jgi:hypothetical protein
MAAWYKSSRYKISDRKITNVEHNIIDSEGYFSYELAKSFRPINLTSFLLKTMARLVDQSIRMGPLKIE